MLEKEVSQAQPAAAPPVSGDAPQAPQITDLDGLSEFTFQGEKYSPDKLHQIFGEWKTHSEKMPEYEKELKFANNLQIDLDNVLNDPRLAEQFKATYPKKYHAILDRYLQSNGQAPAPSNSAQSSLPKEFMSEFNQMKERLTFHEQRAYDAEVSSANAKLDAILPPLFTKYEMANEDQVYSRADALLQGGQKLTDKTWERLVRESHEAMQKKADHVYSTKLKTQLEQGKRGQDVGPGGATPGSAPKKARTFDEAREEMLRHVNAQKNG